MNHEGTTTKYELLAANAERANESIASIRKGHPDFEWAPFFDTRLGMFTIMRADCESVLEKLDGPESPRRYLTLDEPIQAQTITRVVYE